MTEIKPPSDYTWEEAVAWLRQQPEWQTLVRDAYFDDPLDEAAERYWRSEEWCEIRQLLPAGATRALDIGAGRGIASFSLARENLVVTALEPDPSSLVGAGAIRSLAQNTNLPIDIVDGTAENLPFDDNHFDLVFSRSVLHHTANLSLACKEFQRVLKPNGRLIAVREHVISKLDDKEKFLEQHPLHYLYGGEDAFLLQDYSDNLTAAGLKMLRVIKPLESSINFSPYTEMQLRIEIANRLSNSVPNLRGLAERILTTDSLWSIIRPILDHLDNRPGRLYSFVCQKENGHSA